MKHLTVPTYVNERLAEIRNGHASDIDNALLRRPPRSPDLTARDLFLRGHVKVQDYIRLFLQA